MQNVHSEDERIITALSDSVGTPNGTYSISTAPSDMASGPVRSPPIPGKCKTLPEIPTFSGYCRARKAAGISELASAWRWRRPRTGGGALVPVRA